MDAQVAAHLGELAALTAALCWSLNSLAFEAAGRRVGSLAVNYLRIFVAFPLLTLTAWLTRGLALPLDAPPQAWLWLSISGLVGFVFGDIFLFSGLCGDRLPHLPAHQVPGPAHHRSAELPAPGGKAGSPGACGHFPGHPGHLPGDPGPQPPRRKK